MAAQDHTASKTVKKLKKYIMSRKQTSYLFTQCDDRRVATKFWKGRMGDSDEANQLVCLVPLFPEYRYFCTFMNSL